MRAFPDVKSLFRIHVRHKWELLGSGERLIDTREKLSPQTIGLLSDPEALIYYCTKCDRIRIKNMYNDMMYHEFDGTINPLGRS